MNYLVVPSIRENSLKKFLEHWHDEISKNNVDLIIIEDNPTKTFKIPIEHHYSWQEIDADLKEDAWIISRHDSAIRSYGFLIAHRLGAEYTFTLDDDCYPEPGENFFQDHIKKLEATPKWTESILGIRTRGIPYENLGKMNNVVANMGLWTDVPDYDAIQTFTTPKEYFTPPQNTDRVMPRGQYFPFCGMNFVFKREVAVLSYFPLMGDNSPFRRFDDIWFGIIFKKICDHLNLAITCGYPFIHHSRASNPFDNLVKEAPGIKLNETFWEIVDEVSLRGSTSIECMKEVGHSLCHSKDQYISKLGLAILTWVKYFEVS